MHKTIFYPDKTSGTQCRPRSKHEFLWETNQIALGIDLN